MAAWNNNNISLLFCEIAYFMVITGSIYFRKTRILVTRINKDVENARPSGFFLPFFFEGRETLLQVCSIPLDRNSNNVSASLFESHVSFLITEGLGISY